MAARAGAAAPAGHRRDTIPARRRRGEHAGAAGQDVVDERQHRVVGDGAGKLGRRMACVMRNA